MPSSATRQTGLRSRPITRIPTVCIVDPQADDYQGWDLLARANGLRLEILANADEALRFSRTVAVDLWVINTELPGLSGSELCSMLKSRSPAIPIYLVTNRHSPAIEQAARQARATLFGCKPAHSDWLDAWLGRRREVTAPQRCSAPRPHEPNCKHVRAEVHPRPGAATA